MRSISQYVDGPSIAAEIRMERQQHRGSFLLLEGATDIKRLARVVDEQCCSFVNCFGKETVRDATEILYDEGFPGVLGMVDADFERVLGTITEHEGLIFSEHHDFDLDVASSGCFEPYLLEVADHVKIDAIGGPRSLFTAIIDSLKPLGALRYSNVRHSLGYSLSRVDMDLFYDGKSIDIDEMIESVSWGKHDCAESKRNLRAFIDRYNSSNIDLMQLTSGHDFCEALGIALRDFAGSRRAPQTWRSEIEMHFRLAFDREHFQGTSAASAIHAWQAANLPYRLLRH